MTLHQEDIDADIFFDPDTTSLLPVNYRPQLRGKEALTENVVGNMGQTLKLEWMFVKFDALRNSWARRCAAVDIDVAEPKRGWLVIFKLSMYGLMTLDI